ncbi:MAG: PqiC family protein [Lentisphaeria bacterium]|jgi:uncharacterized lipoprotein YmbA|nr:PqiC family protein [Lentisphaeria bacterium]
MTPAALCRLAALALAGLCLFGCARSAPARFYLLEPVLEAAAVPQPGTCGLRVDPLPDYLRHPMLATRIGPHEVTYHEYQRWAEHLDQALPAVLAENLARALGQTKVWLYPWDTTTPPGRVIRVRIERLDADPAGRVTLLALAAEKDVWQRHAVTVDARSDDPADLVAAQSRALAELASRLAYPD